MKRTVLILGSLLFFVQAESQYITDSTRWYFFTDKEGTEYTVDQPEEFLSQRSIDRRGWQSLAVDETDLPVSNVYVEDLEALGLEILYTSKWLNGVLVKSGNTAMLDTLDRLPFLSNKRWIPDPDNTYIPAKPGGERFPGPLETDASYSYGYSHGQITQLNLNRLHDMGYTGNGVLLTVLDAGFVALPDLPAFQTPLANNQIVQTRNFVSGGENVYLDHSHGTNVSSIIFGNLPGQLIGTAPDVRVLLALTENGYSETRIEEYSWIAGAEWADSLGADVLNTSLGYTTFDDPATNYTYEDLDGNTAHISIANGMTAAKGIVSVTSAGNEGSNDWYYISAPADAENILAVGAVDTTGLLGTFSSRGPTSDHRIKPDVCATGKSTVVQSTDGTIRYGSGTSFSSPMIAGATAVLWQSHPEWTAKEIIHEIVRSGDRYMNPDIDYGFGIPDFYSAMTQIVEDVVVYEEIKVYPNPFHHIVTVDPGLNREDEFTMRLIDLQGRTVFESIRQSAGPVEIPPTLKPGLYILDIENNSIHRRTRVIHFE